MKALLRIAALFNLLLLAADSQAQNFTNRGKEFWVGYGHHQYMEPNCAGTNEAPNDMNMVLYLSAEEPATVTVTLDSSTFGFSGAWKKTYNIPANTVIQTENLPKGSQDAAASGSNPNYDARLFDLPTPVGTGGEGIWRKKGIHIESNVPIVAYAHIYGGVSSGATMLMPTETWGHSFTSINSKQEDADRSYSWMYVIAKEDFTKIEITPSATSRRGKPAGVPYQVVLMKGQIYQLVAQSDCATGNGPQLTGTTVKSIAGPDGICHPVAVFSGSSRTGGETLNCGASSGRDNDMQQLFPDQAWGTRYLLTPFSKASGTTLQASQLQTCVYKVVVKDPATKVYKNGSTTPLTGLITPGNYYTFTSNEADYIEADKPVMVAQYMTGSSTCRGGQGDPEMVHLSPLEQAIKRVGFFRNTKEAIVVNYLTLVVPTAGVSSLRIDGSASFDHTFPHKKPGYTVVVKGWLSAQEQCIVKCDSAFNAITYGMGGAESYAFNAGTNLNNLNALPAIHNNLDTAKISPFTCTRTPLELSVLIAYKPLKIEWKLSALAAVLSPNADVTQNAPVPVDSTLVGSKKYYRYTLPGTYSFSASGTYKVPIVATSPTIDNCTRTENLFFEVIVKEKPKADFTFTHTGCRIDSAEFTTITSSGNGYTIDRWNWTFPGGVTSTLQNPRHVFPASGTQPVSLQVVSTEGCVGDTIKNVTINNSAPKAYIIPTDSTICKGTPITLTDTSSFAGGTGAYWYWDLGNGTVVTQPSNTPQNVTYATPGTYIVKHVVKGSGSCVSDTAYQSITVFADPAKPVAASPFDYCQGTPATQLTASGATGSTFTWYDNAALTNGSATAPTPSTATAGTTYFYVIQTTADGCKSDTAKVTVNVFGAISGNTINADQTVCGGTAPAGLSAAATPTGGNGTYAYQWQQSTDGGSTWTDVSGATAASFNPPATNGTIRYRRIVNSGLCSSTSNVVTITVEGTMTGFDIAGNQTVCAGAPVALLDGQTPSGGNGSFAIQWESSADNINWSVIAGATAEDYQPGTLTDTVYYRRKVTSGNCTAMSQVVTVLVNPTPNAAITGPANICVYESASVSFTATQGTAPYTVQFTITAPGGATSNLTQTVSSNGPANIEVITANSAAGNYTIAISSLTDAKGCTRTTGIAPVSITVNPKPVLTLTPNTSVCANGTATLTVSGATTYSWSPATGLSSTTDNTVTFTPTAAGSFTYTVTGTANGCTETASVTITVNPLPAKPAAPSTFTYCQNDVANALTATALTGHTLTWYDNAALTNGSASAPTPSTTTAGTFNYYVTQTNGSTGCVSDTTKITVNVLASIANNTITADQSICYGATATALNGSGSLTGGTNNFTYQWQQSVDGGSTWTTVSGATNASYSPGNLTTTTKYRRLVSSGQCSNTSNIVTVDVQNPITNYEISASQSVCEGSPVALLDGQTPVGTGFTYQWESSADGIYWSAIAGATAEDYQPAPLTATTHYRRQVSNGGCSAVSAAIIITVNPLPNGTLTGPAAICEYDAASVNFTATMGQAPYTIQLTITAPGGANNTITQTINNNQSTAIPVIPANSAAGNYSIAITNITDNKGCVRTTGLQPVSIMVNAQPVLNATHSATICSYDSAALTVTGADTYVWSPATGLSSTTGSNVMAQPDVTTTYTITGITNGCSNTTTVTVNVNDQPAKPSVEPLVRYCVDAPANSLSATAENGNTLTWYDNASLTAGNSFAPTPSTTTADTAYYYVTQSSSSGCTSDTARITVITHPLPTVEFSLPAGICMPEGVARFTNNSQGAATYNWSFGDNSSSTDANPTHTYAAAGSYDVTLVATSAYGCINQLTQTLDDFYEKPIANFSVNADTLCEGVQTLFFDESDPLNSTITTWSWNFDDGSAPNNSTNPRKTYSRPGRFDVTLSVTNAVGCTADTTKEVIVYLQPKIDAGPSFVVPQGTLVRFNATSNSPSLNFSWTPAASLSAPDSLRPSLLAVRNETYTLVATGDGGCTATDSMTVKILKPIKVPNAFSPNGDNVNDKWLIHDLADYPGATVEVYNRYGQLIYQSSGYNVPWDGTLKGKALPLATYYYIINLKNGFAPLTGSVTIVK